MLLTITPVDSVSTLTARSRKSALFDERRKVHLYSSSLLLHNSISSTEGAVAQSRHTKGPGSAKLYLEAKYQKDWRCWGPSDLTNSMVEVSLVCAAVRQTRMRESFVSKRKKRRMGRCRDISAA